ncbi:hypothetical protein I204_06781 [Kwoniella mangroviensis CBS 8886]|nr:hypothetical protein I204_06781 [Kwoniella mangroviensis CBS 8886]
MSTIITGACALLTLVILVHAQSPVSLGCFTLPPNGPPPGALLPTPAMDGVDCAVSSFLRSRMDTTENAVRSRLTNYACDPRGNVMFPSRLMKDGMGSFCLRFYQLLLLNYASSQWRLRILCEQRCLRGGTTLVP